MKRIVTTLAAVALAAASGAASAQERAFTIASWGGSYQDVLRQAYFTPFAQATGTQLLEDVYLGGWAPFEAMQTTGVIKWDVVQVENTELYRGCEEGTFVELDWSRIAPEDSFMDGATSPCGLGTIVVGILPAYNADLLETAPTKLEDFWDLETWPGKRGMRKGPKYNIELALLADGVAFEDVYEVLSTPEGIDRAFAKLDEIKPQIQWWEAGDQAPSWLASGDVAMSIAYNARISNARKEGRNLQMLWDKFTYDMDSWVIVKGTPYEDKAYEFLAYFAQPEPEVEFAKGFAYGVPNLEASAALPEEITAQLPVGEKMQRGLYAGSPDAMLFWQDYGDMLNERWNAWASAS